MIMVKWLKSIFCGGSTQTYDYMWRNCDHYDKQKVLSLSKDDGVNASTTYLTAFYLKGELLGVTRTVERAYSTGVKFLCYHPHTIDVVSHNAPYSDYLDAKNNNDRKRAMPPGKE